MRLRSGFTHGALCDVIGPAWRFVAVHLRHELQELASSPVKVFNGSAALKRGAHFVGYGAAVTGRPKSSEKAFVIDLPGSGRNSAHQS